MSGSAPIITAAINGSSAGNRRASRWRRPRRRRGGSCRRCANQTAIAGGEDPGIGSVKTAVAIGGKHSRPGISRNHMHIADDALLLAAGSAFAGRCGSASYGREQAPVPMPARGGAAWPRAGRRMAALARAAGLIGPQGPPQPRRPPWRSQDLWRSRQRSSPVTNTLVPAWLTASELAASKLLARPS